MSKARASLGYTVNIGDYQSVRIDADIEVEDGVGPKNIEKQINTALKAIRKAWVAEESAIGAALTELEMSSIKTNTIETMIKRLDKIERDSDDIRDQLGKVVAKEGW